jgi:DNA-binding response OmpR family regulator
MNRILVLDDEAAMVALVTSQFGPEGFQVESVTEQEPAVRLSLSGQYALVLLDISLPDFNGFDILQRIRAKSSVPILIASARNDDASRVFGLEGGADDYLSKPFNPRELIARIRAILRRGYSPAPTTVSASEPLSVGDLELDKTAWVVRRAGERVDLTTVEFQLLEALLRSAGRVLKRQELVENVFGRHFSPLDRSVDMHVSNLRRKLSNGIDGKDRIRTVRGVGYVYPKTSETQPPVSQIGYIAWNSRNPGPQLV